ncbi:MAG: nuclear transport factor 2 family protein [Actinomycetota bacterium]
MYHFAVRRLLRRAIDRLNEGDASLVLRLAAPDAELVFPGDNSWATMFVPAERGREGHVTHRGAEQLRAFADRFVAEGLRFVIEDIVVAGPPWNTRVALRAHDYATDPVTGRDVYANRVVAFLEIRWGRMTRWEDYEDTERVAAWDAATS